MGGIGIRELLIVAVVIVLLFGTRKLKYLGRDLGSAIKGFKNAMSEESTQDKSETEKSNK